MPIQTFYTEDTCCLKSNPSNLGVVDRTFHDVGTHHPGARQHYSEGLERHKSITKQQYNNFLRSGVPPRGSVVVCWVQLPNELFAKSTLIPESAILLVDRALLLGDVVRRGAREAMSGTVIHTSVQCDLIPPSTWSDASEHTAKGLPYRNRDNFSNNPSRVIRQIPGTELSLSGSYHKGSTIIYKDWIGTIQETWEDVNIRLKNGSIVVPEDMDALEPLLLDEPYQVGDFVTTRKANLRRGRWIYGAFDANIEPEGHVADVRIASIEVRWLIQKYPSTGVNPTSEPDSILDMDVIDSGELIIYDRHNSSLDPVNNGCDEKSIVLCEKETSPDFCIGDRVRFHDLQRATSKYDGSSSHGKLDRIPKSKSLGFDINVFLVSRTRTEVTVLWQDLTTSTSNTIDLVPNVDPDNDDVWPGQIVTTRENECSDPTIFQPSRAGVVQSVNSLDRMVAVKWFSCASLKLTSDMSILLPGTSLGHVSDSIETLSLYDVQTAEGLDRKLGDIVLLIPVYQHRQEHSSVYTDLLSIMDDPAECRNWLGEIVDIGLDGLCSVRLGLSTTCIRDVRIPLECTILAVGLSSEDEMDGGDVMSEDSSYDSDMKDESPSDRREGVWLDENDQVVGEDSVMDDSNEWTTDWDASSDIDMVDNSSQKISRTQSNSPAPVCGGIAQQLSNIDNVSGTIVSTTARHAQNPLSFGGGSCVLESMDFMSCRDPNQTALEGTSDEAPGIKNTNIERFHYSSMFRNLEGEKVDASNVELEAPQNFLVLEGATPIDHRFSGQSATIDRQRLRRIQKEHNILRCSLPDGVYVRTWEASLELMRVLILGPIGTPYEYAPFVIDLYLGPTFPAKPPRAFFHSWTDGSGSVNPNLYESKDDGRICLSILDTWPGDESSERWSSKSTILQIVVSILGLVLVREPYFNEAGYEVRAGLAEFEIHSAMYTERTFFKSRAFITHALRHPVAGFEEEVKVLYLRSGEYYPHLLLRAICSAMDVIQCSQMSNHVGGRSKLKHVERRVSQGALSPLKKMVEELLCILEDTEEAMASWLRRRLDDGDGNGSDGLKSTPFTGEGQLYEAVRQRKLA